MMKKKSHLIGFILGFIVILLIAIIALKPNNGVTSQPSATPQARMITNDSSDLVVHFISIGQGDATLIESDGHYMLIDAGPNASESLLKAYLEPKGITFDYVIGTHPDEDHIGSLDYVLHNFDVKTVLMPNKTHTTKSFENVLIALEKKELEITEPVPGDVYQLGNAQFTIIAPNKDYDDNNNNSIAILLNDGNHRFLLCGDAEATAEKDMLNNNLDIKADVLKISHHGSSSSTSDPFLAAVDPTYGIISCGINNDYGHPHREVLTKLNKEDIQIYRTDTDGDIIVTSNQDGLFFATTKDQPSPSTNNTSDNNTTQNTYIINTNTKKIHYDWCNSLKQTKAKNLDEYYGNINDLIKDNYEPCSRCKPDQGE